MNITPYLEDLEARIDDGVESELYAEWRDFTEDRFDGDVFSPKRREASPPGLEWPAVTINETLSDFDRMALHQFATCSTQLAAGGGDLLCVRSNYGTGILSTLFGAELFVMDDALNVLPTTRPLGEDGAFERLVDAGVPDLTTGLGGRTLEMAERFEEIRRTYPKIGRHVHHYHSDLQGPIDICELLWGNGLFVEMVDRPGFVRSVLDVITETYTAFLRRWLSIVPFEDGRQVHWSLMHRGAIMLRDDSAMNLSPAMFDEFILPYDQRLLDEFGGGAIHFCGRGDHYIDRLPEMRGVYAVAMSQPEYNDMETIYRNTVDRGIKLLSLRRDAAEAALEAGRDLHGQVHCR